jgi:serine protease
MRWAGHPRVALVLTMSIAAFAATACFGAPPPDEAPPPPSPQACESVGAASPSAGESEPARAPSDQPIPPDQAGAQAREVASTTDVRTKSGEIPLVTVEERGGVPVIQSTPVRSPNEAASVAEQKAADGDLHAVDVDKPVRASTQDPLFAQQWSFNEVPYVNAWTTDGTTGGNVKVAVVDSGVQQNHPDLGSGQVLSGHFFLHSSDGTSFEGAGGDTDPNGHGTHVSGIIAALSGNNTGISGGAPGAKILPVQVLCGDGNGWNSDVASGITWAVDNGAKVINLSLGGPPNSSEQFAVEYAKNHNPPVVVVAAGGNCGGTTWQANNCSSQNEFSYPAAYSQTENNVVAVAATTAAATPGQAGHASYSTVASYIDISAPGGAGCGCNSSSIDVLATVPFSAQEVSDPSGYASIAGTSMATPHVSAATALLVAAANCNGSQVKTRLKATATELGPIGPDNTFGAGLVDPNAAGTTC